MSELAEAIEWLDHQPHAEALTAAQELRRVLEGEQVQWCKAHKAQIRLPSAERLCIAGWLLKRADETPTCSIVPKLLVDE